MARTHVAPDATVDGSSGRATAQPREPADRTAHVGVRRCAPEACAREVALTASLRSCRLTRPEARAGIGSWWSSSVQQESNPGRSADPHASRRPGPPHRRRSATLPASSPGARWSPVSCDRRLPPSSPSADADGRCVAQTRITDPHRSAQPDDRVEDHLRLGGELGELVDHHHQSLAAPGSPGRSAARSRLITPAPLGDLVAGRRRAVARSSVVLGREASPPACGTGRARRLLASRRRRQTSTSSIASRRADQDLDRRSTCRTRSRRRRGRADRAGCTRTTCRRARRRRAATGSAMLLRMPDPARGSIASSGSFGSTRRTAPGCAAAGSAWTRTAPTRASKSASRLGARRWTSAAVRPPASLTWTVRPILSLLDRW